MSFVPITPGSGADIAVDDISGVDFQIVKIDIGPLGTSIPLVGTQANGIPVLVTEVEGVVQIAPESGQTFPVTDNGGSLTVDTGTPGQPLAVAAGVAAPVSVRLSNGTGNVDTLPVSGSVTGAQGAPNTLANAWPAKLTDGTNVVGVAGGALNVNIVDGAPGGAGQEDSTAFAQGTSDVTPIAGIYTTAPAAPTSGQAAAVQITQNRGLHANLRTAAGVEIGTGASPVRIDPTGTTTQPANVTEINSHAIVESADGIQCVGISHTDGTTIDDGAPLSVTPGQTPTALWSSHIAFTASQTAQVIHTPASGKTAFIERIIITPASGATAGPINIFDNTDASGTQLYFGTPTPGTPIVLEYKRPRPLSAPNNVLKYTTGSSILGDFVVEGFDN